MLSFCRNSSVWGTDGQTDGLIVANTLLHSPAARKNYGTAIKGEPCWVTFSVSVLMNNYDVNIRIMTLRSWWLGLHTGVRSVWCEGEHELTQCWLRTSMLRKLQNQWTSFYRSAPAALTCNSSKYSYSENPHCSVFVRREIRQTLSTGNRPTCRHAKRIRTIYNLQKTQLDFTLTITNLLYAFLLTCTLLLRQ